MSHNNHCYRRKAHCSERLIHQVTEKFNQLSLKDKVSKWLNEQVDSKFGDSESESESDYCEEELKFYCPCWPSPEIPYCSESCLLKTSSELEKFCDCCGISSSNFRAKDCKKCFNKFRSKQFLVRALTLECCCYNHFEYRILPKRRRSVDKSKIITRVNRTLARDCDKCIALVKRILDSGKYPACVCKSTDSTNLFVCRPYCEWRVNEIYNRWFDTSTQESESVLTVWQKPEKKVLPTCECWVANKSVTCKPECTKQLSTVCAELYEESCACKLHSEYRISDEYCWVFRCSKCNPKKLVKSASFNSLFQS
jgi:hypothetical protein